MTKHDYVDIAHLKESRRYDKRITQIDIAPKLKDFAMIAQDSIWVMRKEGDEEGYYFLIPMAFADRDASPQEHVKLVKECFSQESVPGDYVDGVYEASTASVLTLVRCTSLDNVVKLVTTPFWN